MGKKLYALIGGVVIATLVALVLVFGLFRPGHDNLTGVNQQTPNSNVTVKAPSEVAPAPGGGPQEGIKVSGHWTIDVLEPSGKLVSHTEFENALAPTGGATLVNFLARQKTPGWWRIYSWAAGASSNHPCSNLGTPAACMIGESTETATTPNLFKTLTVSVTAGGQMRLSGTATAQRNGEIGRVESFVYSCSNTISPDVGCSTLLGIITTKDLNTPVPVLENQQVVVTVDIGFN